MNLSEEIIWGIIVLSTWSSVEQLRGKIRGSQQTKRSDYRNWKHFNRWRKWFKTINFWEWNWKKKKGKRKERKPWVEELLCYRFFVSQLDRTIPSVSPCSPYLFLLSRLSSQFSPANQERSYFRFRPFWKREKQLRRQKAFDKNHSLVPHVLIFYQFGL